MSAVMSDFVVRVPVPAPHDLDVFHVPLRRKYWLGSLTEPCLLGHVLPSCITYIQNIHGIHIPAQCSLDFAAGESLTMDQHSRPTHSRRLIEVGWLKGLGFRAKHCRIWLGAPCR